jgi:glycosyltransferase involved in cell wall biosynthesis
VEVSVLIPVLDEERHLREAAERMLAQSYPPDQVELLFVDGGSTDGSRAILEELAAAHPRVRVLENPARRTPHALNVGLRAARGDVIVRMDAHTHYPQDYLERGVARLRRGDAVSVSGPQIAVGAGGPWSRRIALALSTPLGVGGARFRRAADEEFEVDTGFTGMWLRSTLERAGGWDEAWLTDQDCELAFRLTEAGGRHICVPQMAAEYIPRDSLRRLGRQYWQYGVHKVKTFRRHPRAMRPSHLLPPAVAVTAVSAVASPRPVRPLARAGLGLYGAALALTAARAARTAPPADAAALPAVFATMHLAYGFGLLEGVRRDGVPVAALAGALRRLAR